MALCSACHTDTLITTLCENCRVTICSLCISDVRICPVCSSAFTFLLEPMRSFPFQPVPLASPFSCTYCQRPISLNGNSKECNTCHARFCTICSTRGAANRGCTRCGTMHPDNPSPQQPVTPLSSRQEGPLRRIARNGYRAPADDTLHALTYFRDPQEDRENTSPWIEAPRRDGGGYISREEIIQGGSGPIDNKVDQTSGEEPMISEDEISEIISEATNNDDDDRSICKTCKGEAKVTCTECENRFCRTHIKYKGICQGCYDKYYWPIEPGVCINYFNFAASLYDDDYEYSIDGTYYLRLEDATYKFNKAENYIKILYLIIQAEKKWNFDTREYWLKQISNSESEKQTQSVIKDIYNI